MNTLVLLYILEGVCFFIHHYYFKLLMFAMFSTSARMHNTTSNNNNTTRVARVILYIIRVYNAYYITRARLRRNMHKMPYWLS